MKNLVNVPINRQGDLSPDTYNNKICPKPEGKPADA